MQLDASGGHFSLYDQFPLNKIEAEQQSSELNGDSVTAQKCKDVIRGFSPYCMISPVRPEKQGALQRRVVNKYGYPITARVEKSPVTDLETAMKSHYKLRKFSDLIIVPSLWFADFIQSTSSSITGPESHTSFSRVYPGLTLQLYGVFVER